MHDAFWSGQNDHKAELYNKSTKMCISVIFQSGRDNYGAGIALFTARLHIPQETSHQVVLKALVYLLDTALLR